jgi:hypothetical protein
MKYFTHEDIWVLKTLCNHVECWFHGLLHKFYTNPTPQIPSNSIPIIVSNSKSYLQGWDFEPFQLQDQNSLS